MAAIWKGSVAFGLVNIPGELRTAVRADHISFRLLHEDDLSPVKYERVLMKVIKAKMRGKKVKLEEPVEETDSGVLDLMSRLKASLEQGNCRKTGRGKRSAPPAKPRTPRAGRRKTA